MSIAENHFVSVQPRLGQRTFEVHFQSTIRTLLAIGFSALYAYLLSSLPIYSFHDRINYLIYASDSYLIQSFYSHSVAAYLANEPLWLALNVYLGSIFHPELVVQIIIFSSSFLASLVTLKQKSYPLILLVFVLMVPGVVQNYIVHLRQGVAISLFLIGYFSKNSFARHSLILICPFVHSAFFLVSGMFYLIAMMNFGASRSFYKKISILAIVALISPVLINILSGGFGFRQVDEYRYAGSDFSGIGFLIWLSLLLVMLSNGKDYVEKNLFPVAIVIFYLAIYFILPFAARVIECAIIPIFIAGLKLKDTRKIAFLGIFSSQTMLFYLMNYNKVWFGWGL